MLNAGKMSELMELQNLAGLGDKFDQILKNQHQWSEKMKLNELLMQKGFGVEGANIASDHLIANDVVPVVRCKECRHLEITGCYGECKRGYMGIVKPWDFCSYGERREGE